MSSASSRRRACGHRERRRYRPNRGAAAVVHPRSCAATRRTNRPRPRNWRRLCRWRPGTASPGARALTRRSPRASPPSASGRRIAITGAPPRGPRNGASSNGESEPTKYWLSTLPQETRLADLVDQAKLRWRIERDYQELKQEIGLGHYEGRGWRGFHHHATLAIAAYGFLVSERSRIPPSAP